MTPIQCYLSSKCEIRESPIHNQGVFAKEVFKKGEIVTIFGGDIVTIDEIDELPREFFEDFLQIHEGIYIGRKTVGEMATAFKMNHSCSPNIGVKGQTLFITRRDILIGEELCFDYETTELPEKGWRIICHCGSPECRGIINGEAWQDPAFQKKNEGFFSWYLQEKINVYNQEREKAFIAAAKLHRNAKYNHLHNDRDTCILCEMETEKGASRL